jgi:hypothetical protein
MQKPGPALRLPLQSPPVSRKRVPGQGHENAAGVQAAQTGCDKLTGLQRQYCYALKGVNA